MNRLLRDALVLALVPLVTAAIGLFALIETHHIYWLLVLGWGGVIFSIFEWGGLTNAPWHTISFFSQEYKWLYWAIACLAVAPPVIAFSYGNWLIFILLVVAGCIFEVWWRHHIFHTEIPRLPE